MRLTFCGRLKAQLMADSPYEPVQKNDGGRNLDADVFDFLAVLMEFLPKSPHLAPEVGLGVGMRRLWSQFSHVPPAESVYSESAFDLTRLRYSRWLMLMIAAS